MPLTLAMPWLCHRHSAIAFVTPTQRHAGHDACLLAARHAVYQAAKQKHPNRWSGATRNWTPAAEVLLNPNRDNNKATLTARKAA